MRIGRFEFSPPWWAVLLFVAMLACFLTLGDWQVRRGQAKAEIIAERIAAGKKPPVELPENHADKDSGRRVVVQGVYLANQQLLLDNQVWQERAGYQVWTPLRRADGTLVMIDRGWVELGADRAHPPKPAAPAGEQRVVGFWRQWPEPGVRLGTSPCDDSPWPRVVLYPKLAQVACNYATPVLDGLLLLDEAADGGFPRDWQYLGLPPLRHYGYALQWYAMAVALCAIFIGVNTHKQPKA